MITVVPLGFKTYKALLPDLKCGRELLRQRRESFSRWSELKYMLPCTVTLCFSKQLAQRLAERERLPLLLTRCGRADAMSRSSFLR